MKITIITVTYNSAESIRETLESMARQSHKDVEHIIIDGGSTDKTLSIIEQYKENIAILVSEKDNGIYDAMNKGCALAHGEIIGFLNSDDTYANDHILEHIAEAFNKQKCDVLYGNLIYKSNHDKNIRYWKSNAFRKNSLKYGWMAPYPTLYCKKQVYDMIGHFDTQFNISADYDFILRTFSQSTLKFYHLPVVMINMTIGGASNGSFHKILNKSHEDWIAIKKNHIGSIVTLIAKNVRKISQLVRCL